MPSPDPEFVDVRPEDLSKIQATPHPLLLHRLLDIRSRPGGGELPTALVLGPASRTFEGFGRGREYADLIAACRAVHEEAWLNLERSREQGA